MGRKGFIMFLHLCRAAVGRSPQVRAAVASIAIFIAAAPVGSAPPPGYYDSANGLSGETLKTALYNIIKGHQVYPYSSSNTDTRDIIEIVDEDPNNSNNVLLHYRDFSMAKSSFGSSGNTVWNREHLWPQSLGADVSPKTSDVHALFAEEAAINQSRNNSVFNYVPSPTNTLYGNKWNSSQFEVRDGMKGDVARAIFYMDTRYPEFSLTTSTAPAYNEMGVLTALLQWHIADPVDAREQARNDGVYSFQLNRNPYVDNPSYVSLVYGIATDGDQLSVGSTNRATGTVGAGTIAYPMLSLNLAALSNEWDLQSVTVSNIGTLPDASLPAVKLYRDADNSGTVTGGDTLLASGTFTAGASTLTLGSPARISTATSNLLLAVDVAAGATNGQTAQIRVNANSLIHASSGGADIDPTFANINSTAASVSGGVANGDTLTVAFVNRAGATVPAGVTNYPVATVNASTPGSEWDIASMGVTLIGTLPTTGVQELRLYRDADANGSVTGGDVLLDTRVPSAALTTFTLASPQRITGTTTSLLITANVAGNTINGDTLQLRVNANGIISSPLGGNDTPATFSAFDSDAAAITGGVTNGDSVSVAFTDRAPSNSFAGTANVPAISVTLNASANEWDLGTFAISKLGTLADGQVSALKLYSDENNDGAVDGGDLLLDTKTFTGGNATFALGFGTVRISPDPTHLLVAFDLAAGATDGATIGIRANANGIVSSPSGGSDLNPTFAAFDSTQTLVTNIAQPEPAAAVNRYYNSGAANGAGDGVELLVIADGADLRNAWIKDFSSSNANDGGGGYQFKNISNWSSLPAGTVIQLFKSTLDYDDQGTTIIASLTDTSYFNTGASTFDIATNDMIMLKTGTQAGTANNIHTLRSGSAGTQWTAISSGKKVGSTTTSAGGTVASATTPNMRVSDYDGTSATGGVSGTLSSAAGTSNTALTQLLRGTVTNPVVDFGGTTFTASWQPLTAAASTLGYRLDVSEQPDFSTFVPGYFNLAVTGTSTTVTGLTNYTNYYFRVRGATSDTSPIIGRNSSSSQVFLPVEVSAFSID